ncbi:MAG: alpha/beta hydrolase [Leptonema sp. (in: bacteria)]
MKKKLFLFSFVLDLLILIYFGVSYYFANQIVFFQSKTLEEEAKTYKIKSYENVGLQSPEEIQIPIREITIKGWYFKGNHNCGIVFHHGYNSTRLRVLKYYSLFNEYKCHLLFFDARHHGDSTGTFTTYGYYEKTDLIDVIDVFEKKTGLIDNQIALVGESMGASIIIQFAGFSKRKFKMILADSPFMDLKSIVKERAQVLYTNYSLIFLPGAFWIANFRTNADLEDVSPVKYARDVKTPILILHSKSDDYTPYTHSEEVFKEIQIPEKELILTDWNSKHVESIDDNFENYNQYLKNFIKKYDITF